MIHADAARIASIIAADAAVLPELHVFLDAATLGDADVGAILSELPARIAEGSPFPDERALTEAVRRETLRMLHALALHKMPAMGRA
jgi:hypothetical protein